jgi:type VI secretion system protein ImpL
MNIYLITGSALAVYFVLVWFLGTLLGLKGGDLWILRGGLALIGLIVAAAYYWYRVKSLASNLPSRGAKAAGDEQAPSDIDVLLREAEARMASSELGRKATLASMPVFLFVGREGSAKTSAIVQSGLNPELLAGNVFQESMVAPTRAANFWYARRAALVEAGGKLLADAGSFSRLLRKLRPGTLAPLFGRGAQAPRAAVVCFSCDEFLQPGATDALSVASRTLRTALEEAAKSFGTRLPVYVVFTKTDRIPFFGDYVRNLSNDEGGQVVGVTLEAVAGLTEGVYAERETQRLTEAFNNLFYSLCDRRPDFLAREHEPGTLPGVYEFPREMRKLRPAAVQFLVDLCRPSQLQVGPFLRGFYFSGVRAVVTQELAARPREQKPATSGVSGATSVFQVGSAAQSGGAEAPRAMVTRKVPQWLFLSHLFSDVLFADIAGAGAGGSNARVGFLRRVLLVAAACLALIYAIALIVSYSGNRGLENTALDAVRAIGTVQVTTNEVPPLETLNRLETLRQSLETLTRYQQEGAPWRLRWGLYAGEDLYPTVRNAYYTRFNRLLFGGTQLNLVDTLRRLPAAPAPTDDYGYAYDTLKSYLITTSNHDKSTRLFLSPVLMKHWLEGKNVDPERIQVARKQFDFYSEDLKLSNPYTSENDTLVVERGRRYLSQFAGVERVYQFMLAEASRQNPGFNFNQKFPGSVAAVINTKDMPGAFSKGGWEFMQKSIPNADRFFAGELWVLGTQSAAGIDRAAMEKQLHDRYTSDFIAQWRGFLQATMVVRYGNLKDAATKLTLLSGNQSPLLAALWMVSQNTAVASEPIKNAFQPVQSVVSPESKDRYIGPTNTNYMNALVALQAAVEQASGGTSGPGDPLLGQINSQATASKITTRQMAQAFRIDPEGKVEVSTQKLLEDPILQVEALIRGMGPGELNAKGAGFCAAYKQLISKYPFQTGATQQATIQDVNAVFQPGQGALWAFYDGSLRNYLAKQGSQYAPNPSGGINLNPAFVAFFNRAAAFSDAVYPGGSATAHLSYTMRASAPQGVQSLTLTVGRQALTVDKGKASAMTFIWPGEGAQQVKLTGKFGGGTDLAFASYDGLWAAFDFFADADRWQTNGNVHKLDWVIRQGRAAKPLTLPDGSALTVTFELEMPNAAPVFQKGFLSGMGCVARVAQ